MYHVINTARYAYLLLNFISLYLFVLTFAMPFNDAKHKSQWNILVFCYQLKKMMLDFNMSHENVSDFVSRPLLGFTVVIKLTNFDFETHWHTSIFFDKRDDIRFHYVLSNSVWFKLRCLSRILTTSWQIRILYAVKIV